MLTKSIALTALAAVAVSALLAAPWPESVQGDFERHNTLEYNGSFFHPDGDDFFRHRAQWDTNCVFCHNVKAQPNFNFERREAKTSMEREVRTLAQGNYPADEAFVVVARDPETYSALRALAGGIPELDAAFFKDGAVVGAFLGRRRTSGYAAEITVAPDGGVNVEESAPDPETPVKMVLSAPFRIASVPLDHGQPFKVTLGRTWRAAGRAYRLEAGEADISGGAAGASGRLQFGGDVRVMRQDRLVTFVFELKSLGGETARTFESVTTGVSQTDGRVLITHLDLGPLAARQTAPLRAAVEFKDDGRTFSLSSLPPSAGGGPSVEVRMKAAATSR